MTVEQIVHEFNKLPADKRLYLAIDLIKNEICVGEDQAAALVHMIRCVQSDSIVDEASMQKKPFAEA